MRRRSYGTSRLFHRRKEAMPEIRHIMSEVTDLSTGYIVQTIRVEREDYGIEFEFRVLEPDTSDNKCMEPLDTTTSVPFKSDGTGHMPIWPPQPRPATAEDPA